MADRRIDWIDLARALPIVLVVVYHVAFDAESWLLPSDTTVSGPWWREANMWVLPLRMPLFFVIAGLLAAGAVARPWRRIARPRIADMLWPYVLFSVIFALTAWPRYAPDDPERYIPVQLLRTVTIGSPYWFIAVLPVFFVLVRALRRWPWLLIAVVLLAHAAAPFLRVAIRELDGAPPGADYGAFKLADNAIWFVLGYLLRRRILDLAERSPLPAVVGGLTLFAVFATLARQLPMGLGGLQACEFVATASGIIGVIALLPRLVRIDALRRAGSYLGSRTLAIYLIHPLAINTIAAALPAGWTGEIAGTTVPTEVLAVPVVATLSILAGLAVHALVQRFGPRWIFAAPGGPRATGATPGTDHGPASGHPRTRGTDTDPDTRA